MNEGNGDRDEKTQVSWSQLLAEAARWLVLRLDDAPAEREQGRRPRGRSGQSLTEYLVVVSMIAGVGFGAVTGLRAVMDTTVGKVTEQLENLEFVKEQPGGGSPPPLLSAPERARAVRVPSCKHPRVVGGECQVCHRRTM